MVKFHMHHDKRKKPDSKDYKLWFHLHDILKKHTYRDREQISGCQGEEGRLLKSGMWEILRVMKLFYILIVVELTWLCTYVKLRSMHKKGECIPQEAWLLIQCVVYCPSESPSYIFVNVTYVLKWPPNSYLLLSKWPPDPRSLLKGWA